MNKLRFRQITFELFLISCLFNAGIFLSFKNNYKHQINQVKQTPLVASPEINLLSPENKTYKKNTGDYLCSYDFEDFDEFTGSIGRFDELDGHGNLLRVDYGNEAIINEDNSSGTVEFYFRMEDAVYGDGIVIAFEMNGQPLAPIYLAVDYDWWYLYNEGIIFNPQYKTIDLAAGYKPSYNRWHHIRIEFNCGIEQWRLTVDGYSSIWLEMFKNLLDPPPFLYINHISLISYINPPDGASYFDAFGFSWDNFYTIGDNLKESLHIIFEEIDTEYSITRYSYSLDGQPEIAIPWNYSFVVPDYGHHSFQVFAYDITMYQYTSEIRYFCVSPIIPKKPNATTVWEEGETYDITWEYSSGTSNVTIEIYKGNELKFLLGDTENDGIYSWTIPADTQRGSDWRIKIINSTNPSLFAWSEAFEIVSSIEVTSPINSSIYETGREHPITWTTKGTISNVSIELYKNDIFNYTIINLTENDGEYSWLVPFNLKAGVDYQIRITDKNNSSIFGWSGYFEIYTFKSITITSPNSNTIWERGTSQYITWTTTGEINWVDIEIYKDGIRQYILVNGTENDQARYWEIPPDAEPGDNWKVKITDSNTSTVVGWSDEFEIVLIPDLYVIDPHSTSSWEIENAYYIKWGYSARSTTAYIDINFYKGFGNLQYTLNRLDNDGEYLWTVPNDAEPGIDWYVELLDSDNSTIIAYSDNFEIFSDKSLTFITPDISSEWVASREYEILHNIRWSSTGVFSAVNIEIFKGGDSKFVISTTENDGSYVWAIPTDVDIGTDWYIKITASEYPGISDVSGLFEIYLLKSITVTIPNTNATWKTKNYYDITWTSTGVISNVNIEIYKNDIFECTIASNEINDGRFLWRIPSDFVESNFYQIKVIDSMNSSIFDLSDTYFQIKKSGENIQRPIFFILIGTISTITVASLALIIRKVLNRKK